MPSSVSRSLVVLGAVLVGALTAADGAAQDLHPSRRPSPVGIAATHIDDTYVKVTYGRPYMRGRVIFGEPNDTSPPLVPYGPIWRTGANEATEITITGPLLVAGERLDAGTYSIFTEPGSDRWSVHFSPQLGLDGTGMLTDEGFTADVYDPARDVLVVEATASTLDEPIEQLTVDFETHATGADLVIRWETTEVRLPLALP